MSKQKQNGKPPLAKETIRTPQGTIRKGNRRIFRKATNEEIAARIEFTAKLIVNQKTPTEIHKILRKKHGLDWRTVDGIYISRAKKWLRERSRLTRDQAQDLITNLLLDTIPIANATQRNNLARTLAEIYGVNAPKRVAVEGKDGGPIQTEDRPFRNVPAEKLRGVLTLIEASQAKRPEPSNGNGE